MGDWSEIKDVEPPRSADVYARTRPAIAVMADALGCDFEHAGDALRALVEAGYFIAPRIPSDPMLYGYFMAYGQQAWSPRTVIQNIGKARLRWQAMGQSGTALALSRKFLVGEDNGRKQATQTQVAASGEICAETRDIGSARAQENSRSNGIDPQQENAPVAGSGCSRPDIALPTAKDDQ
jgi:hypothetical protein